MNTDLLILVACIFMIIVNTTNTVSYKYIIIVFSSQLLEFSMDNTPTLVPFDWDSERPDLHH